MSSPLAGDRPGLVFGSSRPIVRVSNRSAGSKRVGWGGPPILPAVQTCKRPDFGIVMSGRIQLEAFFARRGPGVLDLHSNFRPPAFAAPSQCQTTSLLSGGLRISPVLLLDVHAFSLFAKPTTQTIFCKPSAQQCQPSWVHIAHHPFVVLSVPSARAESAARFSSCCRS